MYRASRTAFKWSNDLTRLEECNSDLTSQFPTSASYSSRKQRFLLRKVETEQKT